MKVIGIDPGLINTGYGILSFENKKIEVLDFGIVSPDKDASLSSRLNTIYTDISTIILTYKPDCLSIEEVFYSKNVKTTLKI